MTEHLFAVNTIISHKVRYDILMLKIEQLFTILTIIWYDILMLKSLPINLLKLSVDKGKDEGKAANEGRK